MNLRSSGYEEVLLSQWDVGVNMVKLKANPNERNYYQSIDEQDFVGDKTLKFRQNRNGFISQVFAL